MSKILLRAKGRPFSVVLGITVRGMCSGCTGKPSCRQFVFKPPLNHCKNGCMELLFYERIHLSIDFGHVPDCIPCAVAGALLCGLHCRVSLKAGFQKPVACAVVLASCQVFASWSEGNAFYLIGAGCVLV